jgi:hypothetical protein
MRSTPSNRMMRIWSRSEMARCRRAELLHSSAFGPSTITPQQIVCQYSSFSMQTACTFEASLITKRLLHARGHLPSCSVSSVTRCNNCAGVGSLWHVQRNRVCKCGSIPISVAANARGSSRSSAAYLYLFGIAKS